MTEYHTPELSGAEGEPMTQLRCFVSVNPDPCLWGGNAHEGHALRPLRQPMFGASSACIARWARLLKLSIEREDRAVESESGSLLRELSAKLTEGVHERLPPGMHRDGVARMPGLYRAT